MASKNIVSKLGLKLGNSKSEQDLEKLRSENATLKKTLDDLTQGKSNLNNLERKQLLEKIYSLEKLNEKNIQQLASKEKEILTFRQQLKQQSSDEVTRLRVQIEENKRELERREQLYLALKEENENQKKKCQNLGQKNAKQEFSSQNDQNGINPTPCEITVIQEQLKDALEKNQQWLVYDQQREAYVKGLLARICELEKQLSPASLTVQLQNKEANSEEKTAVENHGEALSVARKEILVQNEAIMKLQMEISELRKRYDEKCEDIKSLNHKIQAEMANNKLYADEKKRLIDKAHKLKNELANVKDNYEEERKKSLDLSLQVSLLQKSLLCQQEEQKRIAALEQQIQISSKDFETEKLDRHSLQQQLHTVVQELRKAREQITRLETMKQLKECRLSEPSSYTRQAYDRQDQAFSRVSSTKISSVLDESFLECPRCKVQYPTSQHRELLQHIDFCSEWN
ncbi:centrosomal protein of 55 kDa [Erpetoichthys calabaricus]|uniref:Centrosomal protein of 55 kDa n=1 Tax=Erpetoichthys calabaricus TaxID=27687 RepID=A0A8C4X558_ERPCA|nr:centrosomal protein of 55 kDa [Erpetoichthys calabaricus]